MKMEKIDLVMFDLKQTISPDTNLDNLIITELEPDNFLIECNSGDPFNGFVYRLKITETENTYEFCTYSSGYGDTGIVVYDKNLNFIEMRDYVA